MAKKEIQEINAGSMADIAFLLLIFFLVTTTISSDIGISRKLPPMQESKSEIKINKRNLLDVMVNRDNKLMVKGEIVEFTELRIIVKNFIDNPQNKHNLPEKETVYIDGIGAINVTKQHVISLMNDRGTSYGAYITVQNELTAAYTELRNELSVITWGDEYTSLDKFRKKAIDEVYPLRVSEAEPFSFTARH